MSLDSNPTIDAHDLLALRVLYVYIEESVEGFRWRIRAHDLANPIESGASVFDTDSEARSAGRVALDKVCRQFRRYADAWGVGR